MRLSHRSQDSLVSFGTDPPAQFRVGCRGQPPVLQDLIIIGLAPGGAIVELSERSFLRAKDRLLGLASAIG